MQFAAIAMICAIANASPKGATHQPSQDSIDSAITDSLAKKEETDFEANKAQVSNKVLAHLRKKYKQLTIDSLAFSDFAWSSKTGVAKVVSREYTAWVYIEPRIFNKFIITIEGANIGFHVDSLGMDGDAKLQRMIQYIISKSTEDAENRYKRHKSAIDPKIISCIKENANDPSSIQFIAAEVESAEGFITTYRVRMRGKNVYGALILANKSVTLSEGDKCVGVN